MADEWLPDVFIGCSSESLDAAKAVQNNLQQVARVKIWTQDTFRPSRWTIQELVKTAKTSDFSIFILAADDMTTSRHQQYPSPRDNTIFEAGLFMGILGVERVFILRPRSLEIKFPSDLLGITSVPYDIPTDRQWEAALGPASNKIEAELRSQGKKAQGALDGAAAKKQRFLAFFGQSVAKKDVKLVFSKREIPKPEGVFDYPFKQQLCFPKDDATGSVLLPFPIPKEVKAWLAYDDMLIATKLSKLFGTECNRQVLVYLDSHDNMTWLEEGPTIAVGLGFTWHTRELLRVGDLDTKVLVEWVGGPPATDAIVFDTKPFLAGGKDHDFALVARIISGGHVHFICAGRTAPGTAAAGRYLAEKWEEMAKRYEDAARDPQTTSLGVLISHPRTFDDIRLAGLGKFSIEAHVFS